MCSKVAEREGGRRRYLKVSGRIGRKGSKKWLAYPAAGGKKEGGEYYLASADIRRGGKEEFRRNQFSWRKKGGKGAECSGERRGEDRVPHARSAKKIKGGGTPFPAVAGKRGGAGRHREEKREKESSARLPCITKKEFKKGRKGGHHSQHRLPERKKKRKEKVKLRGSLYSKEKGREGEEYFGRKHKAVEKERGRKWP